MKSHDDSKPDVEKLIEEIRSNVQVAEDAVPATHRAAVNDEDNLHEELAKANSAYATSDFMFGWRKLFLKPLVPLRHDINTFNGSVVRVLNRLVKLLEGNDLPEAGSMLDTQKRRLTLMEKMSDRLQELEARVKELEGNRKG